MIRLIKNCFHLLRETPNYTEPQNILSYYNFLSNGYGIDNLLASLPRSGFNFVATVLSVAYDLSQNGNGQYFWKGKWIHNKEIFLSCNKKIFIENKKGKAASMYDINKLSIQDVKRKKLIFHTHERFEDIDTPFKNKFKIVLLVRPLIEQIKSQIIHQKYDPDKHIDFLVDGYLKSSINFLNSWSNYLKDKKVLLVNYNDINGKDNLKTFMKIINYFNLPISKQNLNSALRKTTKAEMKKKIPNDEVFNNKRIRFLKAAKLDKNVLSYVKRFIDKNLDNKNFYKF